MFLSPLACRANITFGQNDTSVPKPNCIASAHNIEKQGTSNIASKPPSKPSAPKPNCIASALGRWA